MRRRERRHRQENLTVYAPLTAPPTSEAFRWSNERFLLPRVLRDPQRDSGSPSRRRRLPADRTTLDLISGLDPRLVLYDRSDDYEHFPGAPETSRRPSANSSCAPTSSPAPRQHLLKEGEAHQARRLPERPRRRLRAVRRPAGCGAGSERYARSASSATRAGSA